MTAPEPAARPAPISTTSSALVVVVIAAQPAFVALSAARAAN